MRDVLRPFSGRRSRPRIPSSGLPSSIGNVRRIPEMRQCVEALLGAHREPATIRDRPPATPFEFAPPSLDITMAFDPSADPKGPIAATPQRDPFPHHEEPKEYEGPLALEFLEPSSEPGSFGRLGHHEVLEVLGRGGFGIVVRAFDEKLHRMVAIKVLDPRLASSSPARKRFLREARAAARLRHGNVVQIYAVEERPLPYLVMEYIPGQTLQQKHEQTGPLDVADVLRIGAQIARGLAAAHEQGLIHRDIKPANILLESGSRAERQDHGLRPGPGGRRRQPDAVGRDRRHAAVHGAGAGQGRTARPPRRPVQPRQRAVHDGERPAAVPRRQPAGGAEAGGRRHAPADPPDHPRGAAMAVRPDRQAACQGPRPSLPVGGGSGGPARTTPGPPPAAVAGGAAAGREGPRRRGPRWAAVLAAAVVLGGSVAVITYSLWRAAGPDLGRPPAGRPR